MDRSSHDYIKNNKYNSEREAEFLDKFLYWDKFYTRRNKEFASLFCLLFNSSSSGASYIRQTNFDPVATNYVLNYTIFCVRPFEEEVIQINSFIYIEQKNDPDASESLEDSILVADAMKDRKLNIKELLDLYYYTDSSSIRYISPSYTNSQYRISTYFDSLGFQPDYRNYIRGYEQDESENDYSLIKTDTIDNYLIVSHMISVANTSNTYHRLSLSKTKYTPPEFREEFKNEGE